MYKEIVATRERFSIGPPVEKRPQNLNGCLEGHGSHCDKLRKGLLTKAQRKEQRSEMLPV